MSSRLVGDSMNQEEIGKMIKKIRIEHHLSQTLFAHKLGVSPQAVSKWENGKNLPDISTLQEMKKQFSIPIDEILEGTFQRKNHKKMKFCILLLLILVIFIGVFFFLRFHNENFEFNELISTNTDFKVLGSVVRTNDRTSLMIHDVMYTGNDEDIVYEELHCTLYEEKNNEKTKITSCESGENSTLTEYLKNLKMRMDHYEVNCTMFTETNLFIEIDTISHNKTITYKIPIEISDSSCD